MPQMSRFYFAGDFLPFEPILAPLAQMIRAKPGQYLAGPGEELRRAFYLKSGYCRFSLLQEGGGETILSFHGPGSLHPVKCRQFHFILEQPILYQAMTEAEIWSLEPRAIEELVRREPDFAVAAVDYHTVYSNMYLARQALNARMDVEAKIAAFLYLYAAGREGGEEIPLSQGETASALGVSRVQVSRAYRRLRGLGAIAPYRNGVRILDMELLKSRCAGGLAD